MTINTSGTLAEQYSLGDVIEATEPIKMGEERNIGPKIGNSELLPVVAGQTQDLIKKLFNTEYKEIRLDKGEALKVAKSINSLRRGGSAGVRLICAGEGCEFNTACELYKIYLNKTKNNKKVKDPKTGQISILRPPFEIEGKPCPYEEVVVQDARMRYSSEFQDLLIEGDDPKVLEGYINDLCQIEMMTWRCNMVMAIDYANPIIQSPGAVTSDGRIVWKPEANPILEIQERLQQRKTRILNDLVKTPREKYKKEHAVGIKGDDSLGRRQASLRAKIKEAIGETIPDALEIPAHVRDTSVLGKSKKIKDQK